MTLELRVEIGTGAEYGRCQRCIRLTGRAMAYARYKQAENYVAMAMEVAVDPASGRRRRWLGSDGWLLRYAGNAGTVAWYGVDRRTPQEYQPGVPVADDEP
jgi:hypothetical protein